MDYKGYTFLVYFKAACILVNMAGLAFFIPEIGNKNIPVVCVLLLIILIFQIYMFLKFINKTNRALADFLIAIKNSDFSRKFPEQIKNKSFRKLNTIFNELTDSYKKVQIEKEAQFYYLKIILKNINVGIISVDKNDSILIMNDSAEDILEIPNQKKWKSIAKYQTGFFNEVNSLKGSKKTLVDINTNGWKRQLAVSVNNIIVLNETIKVITFQDIRSDLDRKEVEAWHKLICILRHEISNSVTPISSLTETILMIVDDNNKPRKIQDINQDDINDIRNCISTIQSRSEGLFNFVEDYRELTKIPIPKPEKLFIIDIFKSVSELFRADLDNGGIELKIDIENESNVIHSDPVLIEQVMINLIKNSIEAIDESESPEIVLASQVVDNKSFIEVKDNGTGIIPEDLEEIFVPFFSTKEEGSGIGLSLSRQIIQLHGGNISVSSKPGVETVFTLKF